MSLLINKH